ncbi:hypothetical protein GW7_10122 [Heterocephalus glaber]|uniref:Polysaccharide biosynthesis domain-containing protein n=1 Tax=Heterocephalus glaber TaxID=10181 RepID=G5BAX0_HETGA|nr:hypothetical protein GW7_10122 [Heterocephalus glaber]
MDGTSGLEEPISVEVVSVAQALSLPAESFGNDPDIEMAWAMRTMQHAKVYYKLISSVDPQFLKLTKVDDQIYSEFREHFEKLKIDGCTEENTISAPRIQFYATEIARNREGYNKAVYISVQDKGGVKGANEGEAGGKNGAESGGEEEKVEKGADSRGEKEEGVTREGEKEN